MHIREDGGRQLSLKRNISKTKRDVRRDMYMTRLAVVSFQSHRPGHYMMQIAQKLYHLKRIKNHM